MIPKKIHYCWYGKEMSDVIKKYMKSWDILSEYQVVKWDEHNCNFELNEFTKTASKQKRWAYIGDYFRYLALYEEGGIYLDTDVVVKKNFDDLLKFDAFCGFIFDSSMGTAVLGFAPKHPLLKCVLDIYEHAVWVDERHIRVTLPNGTKSVCEVSNDLLTGVLLDLYPEFKLNGKKQSLKNIEILPKEELELGYISKKRGYCIHKCEGAWRNLTLKKKINALIKKIAAVLPFINGDVLIRTMTYQKYNKTTPYYERYLKDIQN